METKEDGRDDLRFSGEADRVKWHFCFFRKMMVVSTLDYQVHIFFTKVAYPHVEYDKAGLIKLLSARSHSLHRRASQQRTHIEKYYCLRRGLEKFCMEEHIFKRKPHPYPERQDREEFAR